MRQCNGRARRRSRCGRGCAGAVTAGGAGRNCFSQGTRGGRRCNGARCRVSGGRNRFHGGEVLAVDTRRAGGDVVTVTVGVEGARLGSQRWLTFISSGSTKEQDRSPSLPAVASAPFALCWSNAASPERLVQFCSSTIDRYSIDIATPGQTPGAAGEGATPRVSLGACLPACRGVAAQMRSREGAMPPRGLALASRLTAAGVASAPATRRRRSRLELPANQDSTSHTFVLKTVQ